MENKKDLFKLARLDMTKRNIEHNLKMNKIYMLIIFCITLISLLVPVLFGSKVLWVVVLAVAVNFFIRVENKRLLIMQAEIQLEIDKFSKDI